MEPRFQWANEIEVERRGDHFAVRGRRSQAGRKQSGHRDLIAEYLKAVARNHVGDRTEGAPLPVFECALHRESTGFREALRSYLR